MFNTYCIEGVLFSTFLFTILFIYALLNKTSINTNTPSLLFVHALIMIFCVLAFWDTDYYGYIKSLRVIDFRFPNAEQRTHLEPLYVWIAYFVNVNYTLFRLCIWGVSYVLFLKTLQNLDIYYKQAIALFIVYFLLIFSYARVSLGMASLFYGVSLLLKSDKRYIVNTCLGVAMLFLAYSAHKSMFVAIAIFPLIFIRFNKYTLLFVTITLIAVAVLVGGNIISDLLFTNTVSSEYGEFIQERATDYFTSDSKARGIAYQSIYLIQIVSLVLPIVFCYANATVSKYVSTNFTLRCFVNYSTLLLLIGISLGLILSFSSPLSYRFMYMAYIPNMIVLCTLYKNQVLPRGVYNWFFLLFALYSLLRLIYTLYCQIV